MEKPKKPSGEPPSSLFGLSPLPAGMDLPRTGETIRQFFEDLRSYYAEHGRVGGKIGGRSRSKAKREASRANGAKGGRPKGGQNRKGKSLNANS